MADDRTNLNIRKEDDSGWWVIGAEDVLQDASFVTVNAEGDLDSERVLTGGNSITITDGGADTTVTVDLDTPGTLTVATGNAAAAPHTHDVTTSANPGAAASILQSDASGYVQLTGLGITAAPASNDLHIGTGQGITHADGVAAGNFLRANGTRYVPDTLDIADITDLAYAAPNFTLTTANAAGVANTVVRSDASILVFDAVAPTSLAPDDAAATGAAATAARRDHGHGIPCAAPTTNLSVSTTNQEGAGYNFVRDSHTHAIDTSSDPGAAASILASAADGGLELIRFGIGTDPDTDNAIKLTDDSWIGLGSAAGRFVFDSTPDPDQIDVTAADLYFATSGRGIIHVDGVADGSVLVADGTRYIPGNLSDITGGAAQFLTLAADGTLANERVFTPGAGLTGTDNGAGNAYDLVVAPAKLIRGGDAEIDGDKLDIDWNPTNYVPAVNPAEVDNVDHLTAHLYGIDQVLAGVAADLTDEQFVVMALSADLTDERVLTAGDGLDLADGGAGGNATLTVDVTDFLGSGLTEDGANNIDLDWGEDADIGTIEPDDAAGAGALAEVARADHQHAIVCAAPTTNLSVSSTDTEGDASSFARSNHTHAIDSSSNPGAAASLLASAADGGVQLLRIGLGTDGDADNAMKVVDDAWIGLGAAAGRLVFDSTPNPDQIEVTTADLYFATSSHGIIHVDGNQDGKVLVANGTRYVPGDLSDITGGDAQYVTMAASGTLANERVLTAGDGIDLTDGGAGNAATVAVDVTDFLGNGLGEVANNIYCYALRQSDDGANAILADADGDMIFYGSVTFNSAESIGTSAGDLTLVPTGDIILNPTGNDVLPTTNYDISLGSVSKKMLDVHTAEVTAGHIVATDTASGIGGRILVAPTCLFAVDLASGTTNSAEKLSNTGFETAGGGGADVFGSWSESAGDGAITQDAGVYHGGAKSCKLVSGASSNTYVYQPAGVNAGTQVILGFWTQGDGANAGRYRVYDNDNAADILAVASTGVTAATWTKVWYDFTVPVGCSSINVYFYCPAVAAGYAYFDDVTAKTGVQITVTDDDMTDVDIAYAEAGGNVEWFEIASAAGGAGPYTYWVERNLDGGGANDWYAGDGLHNTGTVDEGYIDIDPTGITGVYRQTQTWDDTNEDWWLTPEAIKLRSWEYPTNEAISGAYIRFETPGGQVNGHITSTWEGGAADDIKLWFLSRVGTGVSAGNAVVNMSADDEDAGREVRLVLDSSGWWGSLYPLLVGTQTLNTNQTYGITIDQTTYDDEAFCIKSTDVGHGGFGTDTNTYFVTQKVEAAAGGAFLGGWKDSDGAAGGAVQVVGYLDENVDTTHDNTGRGIVEVFGLQTSGGAIANTVADGNVFSIRTRRGGSYVAILHVDEDGDLHIDGTSGAFDAEDDALAVQSLAQGLAQNWNEGLAYNFDKLRALGVISGGDEEHPFVSTKNLNALMMGAIGQLYERCQRYERALVELGVNP